MYHPHADEMVQMAMGMMGIVHRPSATTRSSQRVDRDFVFHHGELRHRSRQLHAARHQMTEFNLWTWNTRVFPGHRPAGGAARRPRAGARRQSHHDQSPDPSARRTFRGDVHGRRVDSADQRARPEVTTDVPVGAMRAFEFVADAARRLGDPLPQSASHHERHGARLRTLHRRAAERDLPERSASSCPDYMPMGSAGMAEMGAMEMPMPDNTLPMMTGFGQFGPLEMGGMFSVVKVREGHRGGRLRDPGPYAHPAGTVAYEFNGPVAYESPGAAEALTGRPGAEFTAVKPGRRRFQDHQAGREERSEIVRLNRGGAPWSPNDPCVLSLHLRSSSGWDRRSPRPP